MINISLIVSLILILIFQEIIILNEETLILVCFILFNWLIYSNYRFSINQILQTRTDFIEENLRYSLNNNYLVLNRIIINQKNLKNLKKIFLDLKQHIIKFNCFIITELPNYQLKSYQLALFKKLIFTKNIEQQTFKLILLILLKKIEKIATLNQFYVKTLKISSFKSLVKISNREYFKLIK